MFGLMGRSWTFTKGVRELVTIAGDHGSFIPEKREQLIKNALEFALELKISSTKFSAHEQAMITIMTFTGLMGADAFKDAVLWCNEYAKRHGVTSTITSCKEAAADLLKKIS